MLELAAYFALVQIWTAIAAAVALGLFNLLLAGLVLLIAGRVAKAGGEYEVAMDLHIQPWKLCSCRRGRSQRSGFRRMGSKRYCHRSSFPRSVSW